MSYLFATIFCIHPTAMLKRASQFCAVLLFVVLVNCWTTDACHSKKHRRGKRQAPTSFKDDVQKTYDLRSYFSSCLKAKAGDIWDWESVIDMTILDSKWYENSDTGNCSDEDTSDCWKARLFQYLPGSSPLMIHSRACIDEYQQFILFQETGQYFSVIRSTRTKRQVSTSLDQRCTNFYPNSPTVRRYGKCGDTETRLQPGRRDLDFPSINQFFAENTICGEEFGGCGSNDEEILSQSDPSVPKWPFRFEALVRRDSPVYSTILTCNELIFPLTSSRRDDESRCSEWQAWSQCSRTAGPGSQTRIRKCPKRFGGQTQQQQRCQLRPPSDGHPLLDAVFLHKLMKDGSTMNDKELLDFYTLWLALC